MKIYVAGTSLRKDMVSPALDRLRAYGDVVFNEKGHRLSEDEVIEELQDFDGVIAGMEPYNERVFKACKKLKVVSRYGVGYEKVNIEDAKKSGVTVTNARGSNSQSVAEMALGLMLAVARRIPDYDRELRAGNWPRTMAIELSGRTLGIIGLGNIGKKLAKICQSLGMKVIAYSPHIDKKYCKENGIEAVSIDELCSRADVISVHCALNEKTRHIINQERIALMKKETILINTSRGDTCDEEAIYEALRAGSIYGFGTDVFSVEPAMGNKLFELRECVVTPHVGGNTKEASEKMLNMAVDNLITVLNGEHCENSLTD